MSNQNDLSLLPQAVRDRNFHQMQQLIDAGADINAACSFGTPLFAAIDKGDAQILSYLLSLGADPNVSFNGFYPIHGAIETEVEIVNNTGKHPEPLAFMTYILLLAGADMNAVSCYGDTPLKLAYDLDHKQAAALLEARGAVAEVS